MLKVPYVGKPSLLFSKRISKLVKSETEQDLRIVFTTTRVSNYFSLKDDTPHSILSKVVYKFTCPGDPDTNYIGYTNRLLCERVKEHLRDGTAVAYHIDSCTACKSKNITVDNFTILKKCRTNMESMVYEAIFIKRENPKLNRQLIKPGISHTLAIF